MIGNRDHDHLADRIPGQQPIFEEDQPDYERVDAEEYQFHVMSPTAAARAWSHALRAAQVPARLQPPQSLGAHFGFLRLRR
jgi:hypothetical protein